MYTFRFNPVFKQWVMLGSPAPVSVTIHPAGLLDVGKTKNLVAAGYPRPVFMMDAPDKKPGHQDGKLYVDNPPVGEYEVLLAKSEPSIFKWKAKQWEEWLGLVQLRLLQIHQNPQLHHAFLTLRTEALHSIDGHQRVGDLIATSHPIAGENPVLTSELSQKIAEKEWLYKAFVGKYGYVYVPSAPTSEREVWYVPTTGKSGVEQMHKPERAELAEVLEKLIAGLHAEFPHDHNTIQIFTQIAAGSSEHVWWLRISHSQVHPMIVPISGYPEPFLRKLKLLFS